MKFSFLISLIVLVLVSVLCLTGLVDKTYGGYIVNALGVFALLYMLISITHYRREQPRKTPLFILSQCFVSIATICMVIIYL